MSSEHLSPAIMAYIVEQCKQSMKADRQPIVLLTTGSFNPVHRQHVQMHKSAKLALQQSHPVSVVALILSPSCDIYLRDKLDKAGRAQCFIPYSTRCDFINLALEDEHGIFLDKVRVCAITDALAPLHTRACFYYWRTVLSPTCLRILWFERDSCTLHQGCTLNTAFSPTVGRGSKRICRLSRRPGASAECT